MTAVQASTLGFPSREGKGYHFCPGVGSRRMKVLSEDPVQMVPSVHTWCVGRGFTCGLVPKGESPSGSQAWPVPTHSTALLSAPDMVQKTLSPGQKRRRGRETTSLSPKGTGAPSPQPSVPVYGGFSASLLSSWGPLGSPRCLRGLTGMSGLGLGRSSRTAFPQRGPGARRICTTWGVAETQFSHFTRTSSIRGSGRRGAAVCFNKPSG